MMDTTPVLIVDDSQAMVNIVSALFKLCGYSNVDQALSAEEASGKLLQRRYGIVLADMYMTGMNGVDLLARIREHPELRNICFLLMTAMRDRAVIAAAVKYQADGILLKPFTVATLKEKLAAIPKLQAA